MLKFQVERVNMFDFCCTLIYFATEPITKWNINMFSISWFSSFEYWYYICLELYCY